MELLVVLNLDFILASMLRIRAKLRFSVKNLSLQLDLFLFDVHGRVIPLHDQRCILQLHPIEIFNSKVRRDNIGKLRFGRALALLIQLDRDNLPKNAQNLSELR